MIITFEIKKHIEIDENYQGINLTEFYFLPDNQIDNAQLIDTFIRTSNFDFDSLRDCVKKEPEKDYLRQAFNIDKVKITDFKRYNKEGTTKFLLDFINQPDWGVDREDFSKLLDRYFEIHKHFGDNEFFIISKDWFNKDDEKVIEPESWIYSYYFLIISVDIKSNLLTLMEWTYN